VWVFFVVGFFFVGFVGFFFLKKVGEDSYRTMMKNLSLVFIFYSCSPVVVIAL